MKINILISALLSLFICTSAFSCTIFYYSYNGQMFFCNNEDWSNPDTEIRFHPAKDGKYAWVSLGFSNGWAQGGVNEKGLCWDWVAGYNVEDWKEDTAKKTLNYNNVNPSEKMISECATVEDAIKFYEKYNEVSFSYARTMIADRFGNSVIIGWKDGQIYIQRKNNNLQSFGYKGDVVESHFDNITNNIDLDCLTDALDKAHQEGKYPTQYSNIISLSENKIYLYKTHNYNEHVVIDYLKMLNKPFAVFKISDLFDNTRNYDDIILIKRDKTMKKIKASL